MASLHVRNLDDGLVRRLKLRAARNGRSAEAEHRALLNDALGEDDAKTAWLERVDKYRQTTAAADHTPAEILVREGRDER